MVPCDYSVVKLLVVVAPVGVVDGSVDLIRTGADEEHFFKMQDFAEFVFAEGLVLDLDRLRALHWELWVVKVSH